MVIHRCLSLHVVVTLSFWPCGLLAVGWLVFFPWLRLQAYQVSMLSRPWLMCGYDCSVSLAPWVGLFGDFGEAGMGVPPAPVLAPSTSANDSAPPFPIEPAQASRGSPAPCRSLVIHTVSLRGRQCREARAREQELVRGVWVTYSRYSSILRQESPRAYGRRRRIPKERERARTRG